MVAVNLQVRRAVPADQSQIANLIYFEAHVHRHLDWRAPLDWLGSPHYWVIEENGDVIAALACPQDPPGIAWVRLFTCASPLSGIEAWRRLWEVACREIASDGRATVSAIAMQPWFEDILEDAGFHFNQNIVMLEWNDGPSGPRPLPAGTRLRRMHARDLPPVMEVDWSAFEPLWRNSLDAFRTAYSQVFYATVAETAQGMVGYQLSTGNPLGAHLARLAVRPEMQGAGIGAALVSDLILYLKERGRNHLTVNTQSDNMSSQALYQGMGFLPTGEKYPVFIYPL